jgi:hypothetical protein
LTTPLQWPNDFQPSAKRSWFGLLFAGKRAHRSVVDCISQQLLARAQPASECWGGDPLRVQVAQVVCKRAKELYAWPNDHFIPGDPVDIVFLMPWDDLDIVEFVMQMEGDFGIDIDDTEANTWRTLRDVVDTVVVKCQTK